MKLRCKVLERGGRRYLVSMALSTGPDSLVCCAMSEDETLTLELTVDQWNALEFFWFEETGPAERREQKWPFAS